MLWMAWAGSVVSKVVLDGRVVLNIGMMYPRKPNIVQKGATSFANSDCNNAMRIL